MNDNIDLSGIFTQRKRTAEMPLSVLVGALIILPTRCLVHTTNITKYSISTLLSDLILQPTPYFDIVRTNNFKAEISKLLTHISHTIDDNQSLNGPDSQYYSLHEGF